MSQENRFRAVEGLGKCRGSGVRYAPSASDRVLGRQSATARDASSVVSARATEQRVLESRNLSVVSAFE